MICMVKGSKPLANKSITKNNTLHDCRYPPRLHPVLAFKGAPASYPVKREDRQLQRYVRWNDRMEAQAEDYIKNTIGDSPYIGIHLRMGTDWVCLND